MGSNSAGPAKSPRASHTKTSARCPATAVDTARARACSPKPEPRLHALPPQLAGGSGGAAAHELLPQLGPGVASGRRHGGTTRRRRRCQQWAARSLPGGIAQPHRAAAADRHRGPAVTAGSASMPSRRNTASSSPTRRRRRRSTSTRIRQAPPRSPHSVYIRPYDPKKHMWIVDDDMQVDLQFAHDGKQLRCTQSEHPAGSRRDALQRADVHRTG